MGGGYKAGHPPPTDPPPPPHTLQYYTSLVAGYDLLLHLPRYDKMATVLTNMSAGVRQHGRPNTTPAGVTARVRQHGRLRRTPVAGPRGGCDCGLRLRSPPAPGRYNEMMANMSAGVYATWQAQEHVHQGAGFENDRVMCEREEEEVGG